MCFRMQNQHKNEIVSRGPFFINHGDRDTKNLIILLLFLILILEHYYTLKNTFKLDRNIFPCHWKFNYMHFVSRGHHGCRRGFLDISSWKGVKYLIYISKTFLIHIRDSKIYLWRVWQNPFIIFCDPPLTVPAR